MLNAAAPDDAAGLRMSQLMDGDLSADELDRVVAAWRDDPAQRERWHCYHLIGDALRSDELVSASGHDEAFLGRLRERLRDEPVPLAPAALRAHAPRRGLRHHLVAPIAVAAGFVAVAGVLVVLRTSQPLMGEGAPVAALSSSRGGVVPVSGIRLVRDAGLDRYLSAHRKQANGFDAPGGGQQLQIVFEGQ